MKRTLLASAMCTFTALAGCETPKQQVRYVPTSEPLCRAVEITCISKDDKFTEPTAQSIEGNNIGISKVCKRKVQCTPEKPAS